jgi:hypothetical protein
MELEEAFMADLFRDIDATLWSSQPSPERERVKSVSLPKSPAPRKPVLSRPKPRPLNPVSINTPRTKHNSILKLPASSYPTPPQSTSSKRKLQQLQTSSDDIDSLVNGVDFGDGVFDDIEPQCETPKLLDADRNRCVRCTVKSIADESAYGTHRKVRVLIFSRNSANIHVL